MTQYIVPLLVTGHTSVNRMTMDEAIVFARHAPEESPSEWASFNIGELATGHGDARSLIPIAIIILAGGFAIARMARRSAAAP